MRTELTQSDLEEIADKLREFVAGYTGFLSWARGDIIQEGQEEWIGEYPWKPAFLLFAGRGRVEVYRKVLEDHGYALDEYTTRSIEMTEEELDSWLEETYNQVAGHLDGAFQFLIEAYRSSYPCGEGKRLLGLSFDDFLEERDLIEFFLIGIGDRFPTTDLSVALFEHDCLVRETIAEFGLEHYAEEFFPDRIEWYPSRFWWHHRPENRIQHPDSLEP